MACPPDLETPVRIPARTGKQGVQRPQHLVASRLAVRYPDSRQDTDQRLLNLVEPIGVNDGYGLPSSGIASREMIRPVPEPEAP